MLLMLMVLMPLMLQLLLLLLILVLLILMLLLIKLVIKQVMGKQVVIKIDRGMLLLMLLMLLMMLLLHIDVARRRALRYADRTTRGDVKIGKDPRPQRQLGKNRRRKLQMLISLSTPLIFLMNGHQSRHRYTR